MRLPEKLYNQVLRSMPVLAIDGVLFYDKKVLLLKRRGEPFKGSWVLPGGMLKYGETLEEGVVREYEEETKVMIRVRSIVNIYSHSHRDPRGHVVAVVYLCDPVAGSINERVDDNPNIEFFALDKLPNNMGFDHRQIVEDARRVKESLDKLKK